VRFLCLLVVGLALLTGIAYVGLTRVTRGWFEKDIALRSRLAVAAATHGLSSHWTAGRERLTEVLADLTQDERIMGAAACGADATELAATESYPAEFPCRSVLALLRKSSAAGGHDAQPRAHGVLRARAGCLGAHAARRAPRLAGLDVGAQARALGSRNG
jgi:trehalose 6-phosphate synthase